MATTDNRLPTEGTQIDIEARLAAIETALASLMADTTGQSIASAISGLGQTLGSDKANIDGSNIANPNAFRRAIGFGGSNGINSWFSTEPSVISVASGTMVDVYEYTLSVGIYMIHYIGNWDKNATGVRIIVMDTTKASVNGGRKSSNTMFLNSYASSYDGFQEHFRFIGVPGDTPFYFRAFQNSGASLNMYPVINIIKLQ